MDFFFLFFFAFIAGFIDSIVGGGGLIQIPALLIFAPGMPVATIMGTNKFAALSGTALSAIRYTKLTKIPWDAIFPALFTAFSFSFLGAKAISYLDKEIVKPLILVLLLLVAIYTFIKKDFGIHHLPRLTKNKTIIYSLLMGAVLGFYDGFFGPGTGSFLMVVFVSIFGFNFLMASASAKIINCVTNLSALIFFIYSGQILWELAIPLAIFNMAGSWLGARMAIEKGSPFVRVLFLTVVGGMIVKFGFDIITKL